ncbi:unnamed protein product [Cuscuta epithymum]|uniref:Uncharacterized protein n=1 Tax=Cuscuta epithymum TaxID=186058 RepID=A0AAV0G9P3_9ASTE|nr:unnamed protein product [Cuscuta epithymum]
MEGGSKGNAPSPLHTVKLTVKSGSTSIFCRTVNPVSLGPAVTHPANAEEIKGLSPPTAIQHVFHVMSEVCVPSGPAAIVAFKILQTCLIYTKFSCFKTLCLLIPAPFV